MRSKKETGKDFAVLKIDKNSLVSMRNLHKKQQFYADYDFSMGKKRGADPVIIIVKFILTS